MKKIYLLILCLCFFASGSIANAALLDLRILVTDPQYLDEPNNTVVNNLTSVFEHSITIREDDSHGWWSIYLVDDSFFVPENAFSLEFDYLLTVGPGDYDWLVFSINGEYFTEIGYDNSQGSTSHSISGHATIDLTSFNSTTIRMVFGLEADGWDDLALGSSATFSNVELNLKDIPTLSEWGMIILCLMLSVISCLNVSRRQNQ